MPDFSIESGHSGIIAGVDEAGRGPLAGPVIAAAVILDPNRLHPSIADSKKLSAKNREEIHAFLLEHARTGVGAASVEEIDRLNILQASLLAMQRAVAALGIAPDIALIDGNKAPTLACKTLAVVKGDCKSLSIAAASIVAKVTRDQLMCELARECPGYGWEKNAGYGTSAHYDGLALRGVTIHHRRSFAPIRQLLEAAAA